jgi:hypothetical protein
MSSLLQIDQLTLAEKLRIMEELWADLRTRAEHVPVPQWHRDLLDERERLVETGEAQFANWDETRQRLTKQTS